MNGLDPWGNPYVVNSLYLTNNPTAHTFAVSAGENNTFDTTFQQTMTATGPGTGGFTIGSDDIAALIR